jgi:hypothetical protein
MPELTQDEANQLVEWLSEMGDLSYQVAPDPNPVGEGIRLRIISCKHVLHADPPPVPIPPAPPTIMYDSTTAADIPADAQLVAGYVDGDFAWSQADFTRFPHAITITVFGGQVADVCDREAGDLTPDQAASWIAQYPGNIVYCDRSAIPDILIAMRQAGIPASQFSLWIADWTGQAHMVSIPGYNVVATQYANPAFGSGGHYDLSLVTPELVSRF